MGLYKDCCYCCVKFSLISVNSLDPTQSDIFFRHLESHSMAE